MGNIPQCRPGLVSYQINTIWVTLADYKAISRRKDIKTLQYVVFF